MVARWAHNPKVSRSSRLPATWFEVFASMFFYRILRDGAVVARWAHNPKVSRSSRLPATWFEVFASMFFYRILRDGAVVARWAHNPKVSRSSRLPATYLFKKSVVNVWLLFYLAYVAALMSVVFVTLLRPYSGFHPFKPVRLHLTGAEPAPIAQFLPPRFSRLSQQEVALRSPTSRHLCAPVLLLRMPLLLCL